MTPTKVGRCKKYALHGVRVLMFAAIIALVHQQHASVVARREAEPQPPIDVNRLSDFYPAAVSVADVARGDGGQHVLSADGQTLGYVLETSPQSDHLIGFSGPTNMLIACGPDDHILGVAVLSSGDTRDHVAQVVEDESFLRSYEGMTWNEAASATDLDAVSGATLTSLAIQEAIILRLGGGRPSLRFPEPLTVDDARALFANAASVEQDSNHAPLWHVADDEGLVLGSVLRTSPAADNVVGYQGPTETRIGFGQGGRIIGISIGKTYDNEQYVTYVREDDYFLTLFNDLLPDELAALDLTEAGVEGVSGATMTSMAVADGLLLAAEQHRQAMLAPPPPPRSNLFNWTLRDLGTATVILIGLAIALSPLRGNKRLRLGFQAVLILYLGLINGDVLSQAMFVGWAQNGIPWSTAGGLVLLTAAALLVPVTTGRNAYCTHLCPHGAAQQLLKNRLPWRVRLSSKLSRLLKMIPAALLAWCLIVAMLALPFSLVDIEPFDAWVFRVAGWATITIAVVGLVASLFVPMAYCRFGCPTGALLNFLRLNAHSDRLSWRDLTAAGLLLLAIAISIAV